MIKKYLKKIIPYIFNFLIIFSTLFFVILTFSNHATATYLGIGGQYSYSFLNYKFPKDIFDTSPHIQDLEEIGIKNNTRAMSSDYGLSVIIDDGDDFKYLNKINLKLEYYKFAIYLDDTNNSIKGTRVGYLLTFGFDLFGSETNKYFAGLTTGLYFSYGTTTINNSSYQTYEMPIGLSLGNKFAISDNTACIISLVYSYYNWYMNNITFLGGFNNVAGVGGFITRKNEFTISFSYVFQIGSIFI